MHDCHVAMRPFTPFYCLTQWLYFLSLVFLLYLVRFFHLNPPTDWSALNFGCHCNRIDRVSVWRGFSFAGDVVLNDRRNISRWLVLSSFIFRAIDWFISFIRLLLVFFRMTSDWLRKDKKRSIGTQRSKLFLALCCAAGIIFFCLVSPSFMSHSVENGILSHLQVTACAEEAEPSVSLLEITTGIKSMIMNIGSNLDPIVRTKHLRV